MIVVRLGSGWPRDAKVLRPITTIWPVVIFLNHLKSSGRRQGILLPLPITRLSDMAAMALKCFTAGKLSRHPSGERRLHGDRRLDRRMGIVIHQLKILALEVVNVLHRPIEFHLRQWSRLARQLQLRLFEMVAIEMQVAKSV